MKLSPQATVKDSLTVQTENARKAKANSALRQNRVEKGRAGQNPVVWDFRTTAADGKIYDVLHYNLKAILAVGFRVKSPRGTQFRRWVNTQLQELIVKGFVMDDERLKNPGGWDYFDELLDRIHEIRTNLKQLGVKT
ncbi:MAG: RhuM family protein [Kiritimatiellia bacterium]|jgi:hypothetical protein